MTLQQVKVMAGIFLYAIYTYSEPKKPGPSRWPASTEHNHLLVIRCCSFIVPFGTTVARRHHRRVMYDGQTKPEPTPSTNDSSSGVKLERRAMIQSVQNKHQDRGWFYAIRTYVCRMPGWSCLERLAGFTVLRNQSVAKTCARANTGATTETLQMIDVKIYILLSVLRCAYARCWLWECKILLVSDSVSVVLKRWERTY